jgi:hypothetical protein
MIHLLSDEQASHMSDKEFINELLNDKIYVGQEVERQVLTCTKKKLVLAKKTKARVLDIRRVLIDQLLRCLKKGIVKLDKQDIEIPFTDWWDCGPILGQSLFVACVGLKPDPTVFTTVENVDELHPWLVGFLADTIENGEWVQSLSAKMMKKLKADFIYAIGNTEFHFHFVPKIGR